MTAEPEHDLVGSWDLAVDGCDGSGNGLDAVVRGAVAFGPAADPAFGRPVARFRGAGRLEVADGPPLGASDFTIAAWMNPADPATTVLGDAVSAFDPGSRHGFTLGMEHGSPCGSHGNDRTLWFGVDAATAPRFTDHGRPGSATVMVCSLAAFEDRLYAATWENGPAPRGRV